MSGSERYLSNAVPTEEAIGRFRDELDDLPLARSHVLEVTFPAANTTRDVQHGMGQVPTGVIVIAAVGGNVRCSDLTTWTTDLAFLQADAANTRARLYFIVTEVPIDA
jgi:hypothetical protein